MILFIPVFSLRHILTSPLNNKKNTYEPVIFTRFLLTTLEEKTLTDVQTNKVHVQKYLLISAMLAHMQRVVHKTVVYCVGEFWAVCPRPEVNVLIYDVWGSTSKRYKKNHLVIHYYKWWHRPWILVCTDGRVRFLACFCFLSIIKSVKL